jgi:hypothetical protein
MIQSEIKNILVKPIFFQKQPCPIENKSTMTPMLSVHRIVVSIGKISILKLKKFKNKHNFSSTF